ncbi:MAG TPA: hypothetical protein VIM79_27335 [Niastella sp.]
MKFLNEPLKITINKNMSSKPSEFALRKLKEANEHLSKIKNLDEILKRYSAPE